MTGQPKSTLLITGANRGLGLEMTRQYLRAGDWKVEACCRNPGAARELNDLAGRSEGRLTVHRLEVTDTSQLDDLVGALAGRPIDILLNNAGVMGSDQALTGPLDESAWLDVLRANTIAPVRIARAFLDNVAASRRKVIASMTSRMGSIDDNSSGGSYFYRTSKAALNMAMRSMSRDVAGRGIAVVVLHPGWVKTAMGGAGAPMQVDKSASDLRHVLDSITLDRSGRFFNHDGTEIPW